MVFPCLPTAQHGQRSSLFSYNITRQYPYQWFTPITIIGLVVATTLFSLLNFASNAYTTFSETTKDPNTTMSAYSSTWVSRWPSMIGNKLHASCQAADIPVQSDLFTNQTGLTYSLVSVTGGMTDSINESVIPSLSYLNNPIKDCSISSVMVLLESLDRRTNQIAYSEWGATVRVFANCAIDGPTGPLTFNLTTSYDYVPDDIDFGPVNARTFLASNFRARSKNQRASMWWGESCMSMYWATLSRSMQDLASINETVWSEYPIRKGILTFTTRNSTLTDITSLEFFAVDFRFIIDLGDGTHDDIAPAAYNHDFNDGITDLVAAGSYPNVWVKADVLAKVSASTVLTDLGQLSSSFPNIMADPKLLTYFTANFSDAMNHLANAIPGPETQDYSTAGNTTGPLKVTPSVFSRTYICTVPRLKSTSSIMISILVADLVLLQALWKIYKLIVDTYVVSRRLESNFCEGCLAHRLSNQDTSQDFDHCDEIVLTSVQPLRRSQPSQRAPFHRQSSGQYSLLPKP